MLTPPINELIQQTGNRYSLVIASSKRARQIIEGYEPLIEVDYNMKAVSIATEEIYNNKIESVESVDAEIAKEYLLTPSSNMVEEENADEGYSSSATTDVVY